MSTILTLNTLKKHDDYIDTVMYFPNYLCPTAPSLHSSPQQLTDLCKICLSFILGSNCCLQNMYQVQILVNKRALARNIYSIPQSTQPITISIHFLSQRFKYVLCQSILHSSVHRVTVSILYIALPFGSIITI